MKLHSIKNSKTSDSAVDNNKKLKNVYDNPDINNKDRKMHKKKKDVYGTGGIPSNASGSGASGGEGCAGAGSGGAE
jgi:hypothetical protein